MAGKKGAAHREEQVAYCPGCKGRDVTVVGPIKVVKDVDKAPVQCGGCGKAWLSENRIMVKRAEGIAA